MNLVDEKIKESLTTAKFLAAVCVNDNCVSMLCYGKLNDEKICKVIVNLRLLADKLTNQYINKNKNEFDVSKREFEGAEQNP